MNTKMRKRTLWSIVAAITSQVMLNMPATAVAADAGWAASPEFHLAAISHHLEHDGGSLDYGVTAATLELTLHSESRPYWGGPFVDYRVSTDGRIDEQLNLGAYFRYNWPRWDATNWVFVNRSPGHPDTWLYATRIRYRVAGPHKLGIEAMAPLDDADAPLLMGGYYGSMSKAWSVTLLAGSAVSGPVDFAARFELSWHWR